MSAVSTPAERRQPALAIVLAAAILTGWLAGSLAMTPWFAGDIVRGAARAGSWPGPMAWTFARYLVTIGLPASVLGNLLLGLPAHAALSRRKGRLIDYLGSGAGLGLTVSLGLAVGLILLVSRPHGAASDGPVFSELTAMVMMIVVITGPGAIAAGMASAWTIRWLRRPHDPARGVIRRRHWALKAPWRQG